VEPHFAAERTANILTGPELFRFRKGVEDMGKRAPCRNCDRELTIVADGCCFLCYRAGKGLDGEEKEAALAAEAARIKGGKIKKAWNRGPEKIAPAFSLDPLPPVKARHDGPNEIP